MFVDAPSYKVLYASLLGASGWHICLMSKTKEQYFLF